MCSISPDTFSGSLTGGFTSCVEGCPLAGDSEALNYSRYYLEYSKISPDDPESYRTLIKTLFSIIPDRHFVIIDPVEIGQREDGITRYGLIPRLLSILDIDVLNDTALRSVTHNALMGWQAELRAYCTKPHESIDEFLNAVNMMVNYENN
jgi:hypothetical protein